MSDKEQILTNLQEIKKALEFYTRWPTVSTYNRSDRNKTWEQVRTETMAELDYDVEYIGDSYDGHENYCRGSRHAAEGLELLQATIEMITNEPT